MRHGAAGGRGERPGLWAAAAAAAKAGDATRARIAQLRRAGRGYAVNATGARHNPVTPDGEGGLGKGSQHRSHGSPPARTEPVRPALRRHFQREVGARHPTGPRTHVSSRSRFLMFRSRQVSPINMQRRAARECAMTFGRMVNVEHGQDQRVGILRGERVDEHVGGRAHARIRVFDH